MSDFGGFSEFSVGSVIGNAWNVMWRKPLAFLGITVVSSILSTLMAAALAAIFDTLFSWFNIPARAFIIIATVGKFAVEIISTGLGFAVFQGALTYAIFMLLQHGGVSMGEAFQRSASRVLAIFFATMIIGFAIILMFIVPAVMGTVPLPNEMPLLIILFNIISIIAAIVFGVKLLVKWSVFAPVCVIEKTGAIASLGRSSYLTEGYRGEIFGIFILVGLILVLFIVIAESSGLIFVSGLLRRIVVVIVSTLPLTFLNVLPAVIYFRLRIVKENFTLDSLADIFD